MDRNLSRSPFTDRGLDYLRSDSCLRWKPAGGLTPNTAPFPWEQTMQAETYTVNFFYHSLIEKPLRRFFFSQMLLPSDGCHKRLFLTFGPINFDPVVVYPRTRHVHLGSYRRAALFLSRMIMPPTIDDRKILLFYDPPPRFSESTIRLLY